MFYIIGLMCFEECAHECCSLELAIGIERQTQRERERETVCERERYGLGFLARGLYASEDSSVEFNSYLMPF